MLACTMIRHLANDFKRYLQVVLYYPEQVIFKNPIYLAKMFKNS
jgi:hypothetical protein